jgi:hypothetical protein
MDAIASLGHSDAALASPELETALGDADARAGVADPAIKVTLVDPEVNVSRLEASDECVLREECIDQYLWSVYEHARKVDTVKVQERIKATVKKNGKSRTVTKTVTKLVEPGSDGCRFGRAPSESACTNAMGLTMRAWS